MKGILLVGIACASIGCGRLGFDEADEPEGPDASTTGFIGPDRTTTGYRATAVRFDPSANDFMWAGALTNTTSSGRGTLSAWFRFHGGDDQQQLIAVAQIVAVGGVVRSASNRFHFVMQACTGLPLLDMQTQGSYTTASGWVHVLASWDTNAGRADLYVNDVADRAPSFGILPGPICYDSIKWGIGGLVNGQLDADVADFYAALGTYIDLSVEANRRRFRDAAGKPVDLDAACSGPTGAMSSGCFVGDASTWAINKGAAAGFRLEGDGLARAPTSPSD